jgi:iron-sulfur cluster repair protein YtfE (RIC family)
MPAPLAWAVLYASAVMGAAGHDSTELTPSQVRKRILQEHEELRGVLISVEATAKRVLGGDREAVQMLRHLCRALHVALSAHLDLEDAVLAPALRDTDAFGPDRADELLEHHAQQRQILHEVLSQNPADPAGARRMAEAVLELVAVLRADMDHEDKHLLDPRLLKDDPIVVDGFTG